METRPYFSSQDFEGAKIDSNRFPLPIALRQRPLLDALAPEGRTRNLAYVAAGILNYDNGVLLDPDEFSVLDVVKPVYDWYSKAKASTHFFNLPPSLLSLEKTAISVKTNNHLNDLTIWEAFTNTARDTLKGLPEGKVKEELWMSIYADFPGLDRSLVRTAEARKLLFAPDLLVYLRQNVRKEREEGRLGDAGAQEIDTLNAFETGAVSSYASLAQHEVRKLVKKVGRLQGPEAAANIEAMSHETWFHNTSLLTLTLENSGNDVSFNGFRWQIPRDWEVAFGGIHLTAIAMLDQAEESRVRRNNFSTPQDEVDALKKDMVILKDLQALNQMHSAYLRQWEGYSLGLLGFEKMPVRPFMARLINRFTPVYNQIRAITQS